MTSAAATAPIEPSAADMRLVIGASSLGTVFEWYDFFIYGTLATIIGKTFVPSDNELVRQLVVWAGFAVGFGFIRWARYCLVIWGTVSGASTPSWSPLR